jgi:hypothetical protein
MARQTKAEKALDAEIDQLYRVNCSGVQIPMLDIPKVFAVAKQARAEGKDMKEAILAFVATIRRN